MPCLTPLFGTTYGDDILLSCRNSQQQTVFVRVQDIEYYILIAKLPGYSNKDFETFLQHFLPQQFSFTLLKQPFYEQSVKIINPYTYYKIIGPKNDLIKLSALYSKNHDTIDDESSSSEDNYTYYYIPDGYLPVHFYKDNYLIPDIQQDYSEYFVSKFYFDYLVKYNEIQHSQLQGDDYIIYKYIRYPFRCTKQDIQSIEYKYSINFFDTIEFPSTIPSYKSNKYNCDIIYYVPIDKIHNTQQSNLYQDLKYYKALMFDIENYVVIDDTEATFNKLNSLKNFDKKFVKRILDDDQKNYFSDQQELICVSFIEQDFTGQILNKIALVRDIGNPTLTSINQQFEENLKPETYATHIIITHSEEEMLHHIIKILSDPQYHIIQHYNGWKFDEKYIMSRMVLYNLLDKYLYSMKTIYTKSYNYIISTGRFKLAASRMERHLCQIKDPLKFSLDVYQIYLRDSVDAQKHDDNKLNTLLKLHNLDAKSDVSYQELSDWFKNKDPRIIKGYQYCQRDSIQTCKLQAVLKIIINNIQFSNLCQIPLRESVQKAVGAKVCAIQNRYYFNHNIAVIDTIIPYFKPQYLYEKGKPKYLKNQGGEVICFISGFETYVSAVDASSMYPAQVEANNISNDCMLYPNELMYLLLHLQQFGLKSFKVNRIIDMYSPYSDYKHIQYLDDQPYNLIKHIYYTHDCPKYYRYQIIIDNNIIFEQFFFSKTDMSQKYNYVFYQQGQNKSPKAQMLTSLRFLRKSVKKQLKQATDPDEKSFLDGKQLAIKVVMNSTYGAADTDCYTTFENIGPSVITQSSRFIIQNCRDNLQSQQFLLPESIIDKIQPFIKTYNDFLQKTLQQPSDISISLNNNLLTIPEIKMKYQDTDSNYIIMPKLKDTPILPQYKENERYIKTQIFGNFNSFFCELINNIMNKFPLEFDFEGAFYKCWHIQKKMYLGQKVDCNCCHFDSNNNLVIDYQIYEKIKLSDFNPEDDIYQFMSKRHLKITGLGLIKRDTILLTKRYYLKLIETILNKEYNNLGDYVLDIIKDLRQNISTIPIEQFFQPKKINKKDFAKSYLINYNKQNLTNPLGLGDVMNTFIIKPNNAIDDYQYVNFTVEDQKIVANNLQFTKLQEVSKTSQLHDVHPYYAYYIYQIYVNLLTFIAAENNDSIERSQLEKIAIKQLLSNNLFTQVQKGDYTYGNIAQLIEIFQEAIKQHKKQQIIYNNICWSVERIKNVLTRYLNSPKRQPQYTKLIGNLMIEYIEKM